MGSYPIPDWLAALPTEQARQEVTRMVFRLRRQAGIDRPTDGERHREQLIDILWPETEADLALNNFHTKTPRC